MTDTMCTYCGHPTSQHTNRTRTCTICLATEGRANDATRRRLGITRPCRPGWCRLPVECDWSRRACADKPTGPDDGKSSPAP